MQICLADKKDATQIARIHKQEISQGFLSSLGEKFLAKLYEAIIKSPGAFVIVAKKNNQIIGFISGCANTKKFYRYFVKRYFFQALFILLLKIQNLKKILETLKYSQENKNLPKAELLTIAVIKKYQGRGIAQKLFKKFFQEMRRKKITKFKVIVGENLIRANRFYEKSGFRMHSCISIHNNQKSRIYIYDQKTI
ncbi:MAG: GNAT family N-acetyltransferase [bacterium]